MNAVKLLCFPYAGGAASVYNRWKLYAGKGIEIVPIELAGRGKRIREPLYQSMGEAVEDLYRTILPLVENTPYAFWGHSMGGSIAFELCRKIIGMNRPEPLHLFISGRCPPSVYKECTILHNLPLQDLKEEILDMGGTQSSIFENQELMEIFLPILRADFKLIEEYEYTAFGFETYQINCGITAFTGTQDSMATYADMRLWEKHTRNEVEVHTFEGGHFFIHDSVPDIMRVVNGKLDSLRTEHSFL